MNDAQEQHQQQQKKLQDKKQQLAAQRKQLPVYRYKKEICDLVEQKEVVLYVQISVKIMQKS